MFLHQPFRWNYWSLLNTNKKTQLILPKNKKIILFDGVCNLCNASVQLIIKHDKNDVFRFAAKQSAIGQEIIKIFEIDSSKTDSIILYDAKIGIEVESKAAFSIAKDLEGIYHYLFYLSILPAALTDFFYRLIAKNRYKWFGKNENCMIPTASIKTKFLE